MELGAAGPVGPRGPAMHWIGPPTGMDDNTTHYRTAQVNAQQISIGDFVYLQPAEPNIPLYIARVEDLIHLQPSEVPPPDPAAAAAAAPPSSQMTVAVSWYYRPHEISDLDHPIHVYDNEVFASDEIAQHDLASVAGRCSVVPPGSPSLQLRAAGGEMDMYVCSRKYVPEEARIVPLEGVQDADGDEARPSVLIRGQVFSRGSVAGAAGPAAAPGAGQEAPAKRRKKAPATAAPKQTASPTAVAAAAGGAGGSATSGAGTSRRKRRAGALSAAGATNGGSVVPAASASISEGQGTPTGGRSPRAGGTSAVHGRWTAERYDSARRSLIHVLRALHATAPEVAVLRPALRDEARKVIGDTGLLDHLLKHLADTVVSEGGEKLRRRHNRHGQMVYWLQSPEEAAREEAAVATELGALSEELREVREARTALAAVRSEAAAAIQAVSELKEKPEEAAASLGAAMPAAAAAAAPSVELAARVDAVEGTSVDLARRLHDAEALAAAGFEGLRGEIAAAGRLLGGRVEKFSISLDELRSRCAVLESGAIKASEEAAGRFEATTAALQSAVGAVALLQGELAQRDAALATLRAEVIALGQIVTQMQMNQGVTAFLPPHMTGLVPPLTGQQQQPVTPPVGAGIGGNTQNMAVEEPPLLIPGQELEAATRADAAVAEAEAAAGRNPLEGDPARVSGIDATWPQGAGHQGVGE